MTWVRIPDKWWSDPDALDLSAEARDLLVRLLAYAADHRTDGRLTRSGVAMVARETDAAALMNELVAAGFLETAETGWQVVDPERYLFTAAMRQQKAEAGRKGGLSKADQHGPPDQGPDGRFTVAGATDAAVAGAQADATVETVAVPSRPVPSRPVPGPRGRAREESPLPHQPAPDTSGTVPEHRARTGPDDPAFDAYSKFVNRPGPGALKWLDELAELYGEKATADAIAGAGLQGPVKLLEHAKAALVRSARAADRAEAADEKRRLAEKRKPDPLLAEIQAGIERTYGPGR